MQRSEDRVGHLRRAAHASESESLPRGGLRFYPKSRGPMRKIINSPAEVPSPPNALEHGEESLKRVLPESDGQSGEPARTGFNSGRLSTPPRPPRMRDGSSTSPRPVALAALPTPRFSASFARKVGTSDHCVTVAHGDEPRR